MHWFHAIYEGRETFDSLEEELAYREAQMALTRNEAHQFKNLLGLHKDDLVLELFCGNGRHSVSLAGLGIRVVGVDLARSRVAFASRWAKDQEVPAFFLVADAGCLPVRGKVKAVLILGGSFSHMASWDEDVRFLKQVRNLLTNGGRLLIDNPNPVRFWTLRNPQDQLPRPEELPWFDLPLKSSVGPGHVRYWGAHFISMMLEQAGFIEVELLGDRQGAPYCGQSPRLISIGRTNGV
ncbi:MAG: class I SAM-dependent methyltransferase [bacterium]